MVLNFLKSKLHGAIVTHSELEYDGSCAIDSEILKEAKIHEYEKIEIYNITNGERFSTYTILAQPGSSHQRRSLLPPAMITNSVSNDYEDLQRLMRRPRS